MCRHCADGEEYTMTVQQNFAQIAYEISSASAVVRDMSRLAQYNKHDVVDLKANPDSSKPKPGFKTSSQTKGGTRLHNLVKTDSQSGQSDPESMPLDLVDEDNADSADEVIQPLDTAANNLNTYAVPARKPVTVNNAVRPKSKPNNGADWVQQGDKPCHSFIVQGSCHKQGCPYSHNHKLRNYTIDKLTKERATNAGDPIATTLHNMGLYQEVLDRYPSTEEYHALEDFCNSQSETSEDVDA